MAATRIALMPGVAFSDVRQDVESIVPITKYQELSGWDKLAAEEQKTVLTNGRALAQSMLIVSYSRMAIGAHLMAVQSILEPHGIFVKFLRMFHFSQRTAYRFISRYKNAKANLPDPIIKAAIARGIDIASDDEKQPLGKYTAAAKALPAPVEPDAVQANTWLDQIETVRKKGPAAELEPPRMHYADANNALREVLWFARSRFGKIAPRKRQAWAQQILGLLATEFKLSTVQPMPIPAEFVHVGRGRPRSAAAAA
jgi:hypothetical protein